MAYSATFAFFETTSQRLRIPLATLLSAYFLSLFRSHYFGPPDITADYTIIMSRTLKVTSNHVKFARFVLIPVTEEAKT